MAYNDKRAIIELIINIVFPDFELLSRTFDSDARHSSGPILLRPDERERVRYGELKDQVAAYRDGLWTKTYQELEQLQLEAFDQTEFFNRPNATADHAHAARFPYWTLDAAIALSLDKSPDSVTWENLRRIREDSSFKREYARRRDLAMCAVSAHQMFDPVLPAFFVAWADRVGLDLPDELKRRVSARGIQAGDWSVTADGLRKQYDLLKAAHDPSVMAIVILEQKLEAANQEIKALKAASWEGFDDSSEEYPAELDIALQVWRAVSVARDQSKGVREQIVDRLNEHHPRLSKSERERIATVCNWDKKPGRRGQIE